MGLITLLHRVHLFVTFCKTAVELRKLVEDQVAIIDRQLTVAAFGEGVA